MGERSGLPNIGPVVEKQLNAAGVKTGGELRALGAREAWLRIQAFDPSACIRRLLAPEGAIRGVPKAALPPEARAELKAFSLAHRARAR